ncbi:nitrite reductase [Comamonas sp. 26]|uniref:nitrite reductase n=1 Tax=Comamonas sp. 26 TaxID=2035201 RepID=UPI000C6507B0|nr:nitrite reductase [Comamonas sp. 26]PIG09539.1 precorrin-3B synthase [Comamonas sp. 26]
MSKSAAIKVQGWCPTVWAPMQAQDGWIVRVRPHCASISAQQWTVLAELSLSCAHPEIEMTRLGNVQLRGVSQAQLPLVHSRLVEAQLVPADADADQAPAVHCTPFYQRADLTHALALLLSQAVITQLSPNALKSQGVQALPSKFGLAVDDAQRRMRGIAADISVWVTADERYGLALGEQSGWYAFDGASEVVAAALAVALWFAKERTAIAPMPTPTFTRLRQLLPLRALNLPCLQRAEFKAGCMVAGAAALPGRLKQAGRVIGVPMGRISAAALLEAVKAMSPQTEVRVTPWRSLFCEDEAIAAQFSSPAHWITEASDSRLRVSACAGAPQCTQALLAARELALMLAPHVPTQAHVHVSGCAKCCALSPEATAVLIATEAPAGDSGQALLNLSWPNLPRQPFSQISTQALRQEPSHISTLIHDLHIRNPR